MALTKIDDRGLNTPIDLLDNEKIRFGTGNDLEVYHNGSHSYIKDAGTGNLVIQTNMLGIQAANGLEDVAKFTQDGACELFYNNFKSFATGSNGIILQGPEGGDAQIDLNADEGDDNPDKWRIVAGQGGVFQIKNYSPGSWDVLIDATVDAGVGLYHNNAKKLETTSAGVTIYPALKVDSGDIETYMSYSNGNSTGIIGTESNHSLEVRTNNTERFRVDTSGNIDFNDSVKTRWGTGNDLQIYHDGSASYIKDAGTGALVLAANDLQILNAAANEYLIRASEDVGVKLYYNNNLRLETITGGVQIKEDLQCASDGGADNELKWDYDEGKLYFKDNIMGAFGTGGDLWIYHDGTNSEIKNRTGDLRLWANANDLGIKIISNDAVQIRYDDATKIATTSSGCTVTGSVTETSDIALKTNIEPLDNVLEKIQQITGYKYQFKDTGHDSMGVTAQDVEKVFPELVHGEEGTKSLQYSGLIGALIESVKELSNKVSALEAK